MRRSTYIVFLGPVYWNQLTKCVWHTTWLSLDTKSNAKCFLPLDYDGVRIDAGYRLDMRIDGVILVENKVVEALLPVHHAQLITYLKLTGLSLGFLINWNVPLLRDGIKRIVL